MGGILEYGALMVAVGAACGFLFGLFGIGGGIILIPVFLIVLPHFGVPPEHVMHLAVGTSLALVLPSGITATLARHRLGMVDLDYWRRLLPGLLAGIALALVLSHYVSGGVLQIVFVVFVFTMAVYLAFGRGRLHLTGRPPEGAGRAATGFGVGLLSTLLGIGGGSLLTPLMVAMRMEVNKAMGLSAAISPVIGGVGAVGFVVIGWDAAGLPAHTLGYIDLPAFVAMAPTVALTAPLGARLAHRLDQTLLTRIFALFLVVVGAHMIQRLVG